MEFLERVGDFFTAATNKFERGITNMFGSSNERRVRNLGFVRDKQGNTTIASGSMLEQIASLEPEWETKTDAELKQTADLFRARLRAGEYL